MLFGNPIRLYLGSWRIMPIGVSIVSLHATLRLADRRQPDECTAPAMSRIVVQCIFEEPQGRDFTIRENALKMHCFFPCDICQRFYDELLVVFRFRKSLVPRGKLRSEFLATSIPGPEKTMAQLSEVFLEGETPQ